MASWNNSNEAGVIYLSSNVCALGCRYATLTTDKDNTYTDKDKLLLLNKPSA